MKKILLMGLCLLSLTACGKKEQAKQFVDNEKFGLRTCLDGLRPFAEKDHPDFKVVGLYLYGANSDGYIEVNNDDSVCAMEFLFENGTKSARYQLNNTEYISKWFKMEKVPLNKFFLIKKEIPILDQNDLELYKIDIFPKQFFDSDQMMEKIKKIEPVNERVDIQIAAGRQNIYQENGVVGHLNTLDAHKSIKYNPINGIIEYKMIQGHLELINK